MEFPRSALIGERLLAAALFAAAFGAAWAETRSTLAGAIRRDQPWLAWVESRQEDAAAAPGLSLAIYHPSERRLALLNVPGATKLEGKRTLERAWKDALSTSKNEDTAARAAEDLALAKLRALSMEPVGDAAARLRVSLPPLDAEQETAVEAGRALKERLRHPTAWLAEAKDAWRRLRAGEAGAMDGLLFAVELRRVPLENLAPARLSEDALAPGLISRLLRAQEPASDTPSLVEVLNCTPTTGLARKAAKMLRSKGADVVSEDSGPARERSMVYDRTGDYRRAAAVLAALGCPRARAATRLDPSRAVDVSVELGADCVASVEGGASREP